MNVKKLFTTKTTQKMVWALVSGTGLFVCTCIVFKLNDASMRDFHEWHGDTWKIITPFMGFKMYLDKVRLKKGETIE